jgi:Zn-finger nucleic acid-binding protein
MEKYICDNCGFSMEFKDASEVTQNCPVCKGIFVSEALLKEHEEMEQAIEHEGKDDDLTPFQDAREAEKEHENIMRFIAMDFVINAMKKNIKDVGIERTHNFIERERNAKTRARCRTAFLLAGGHVPEGETIHIKEKDNE